ncbi:MAG: prolipoprotein diacylglyceryl transferase [Oscillospiraceae bacterium]|jgi:phosphatidylglycerol:prolipoprotein diacylglycerol transferase|nr:prolipoprotein diacylglyceryl transferase [Oscillospiraceae bacterium]
MSDPRILFDFDLFNLEIDFPSGFTVFGWTFHLYGVIIAVGFLLAVVYALSRAKSFGIRDDSIIDMLLFGVPLAVIGARVYYVLFSDWNFTGDYAQDFKNIATFWNGGLAIYGGLIGALAGILLFSLWKRRKQKDFKVSPYLDIVALGFMIGQCIGRWGNFTNRECYGPETDLPWKMGIAYSTGTIWVHPTFLYESLWNLVGFIALHFYSKRRKFDGEIFALYLGWYGIGRFWIEALRTDSLYIPGTSFKVSQVVALACLAACIVTELVNRLIRKPSPDRLYVNRPLVAVAVSAASAAGAAAGAAVAPSAAAGTAAPIDESELDAEFEKLLDQIDKES